MYEHRFRLNKGEDAFLDVIDMDPYGSAVPFLGIYY
jgi:tRNA G26 N,N-dimethylase Trm1